jgi:FeS assembly SUF system protein
MEESVIAALRSVYDPEIPVNVYDLGLIYSIDVLSDGVVSIDMTLTAPHCPVSDYIVESVQMAVGGVAGVTDVRVNLVFEPEWTLDRISDAAKLELGLM